MYVGEQVGDSGTKTDGDRCCGDSDCKGEVVAKLCDVETDPDGDCTFPPWGVISSTVCPFFLAEVEALGWFSLLLLMALMGTFTLPVCVQCIHTCT